MILHFADDTLNVQSITGGKKTGTTNASMKQKGKAQGFPHIMKYDHKGETETTTICSALRVPFSPPLWNYIPRKSPSATPKSKTKAHTKSFISQGEFQTDRAREGERVAHTAADI